ncbi:hypothetical protein HPP92_021902 [Vanilla planifolia]|uniref:Uncharacterized protein n=1 Tax=Vanilla planifolia TaxID=51239 RepID=A0A835PWB8_VANPL|nr:hypothetical protein HPP92_022230 [Vanilla planifolia]KAG0458774.1 hypothetical protein HPP92_021902 [Vanilla planifolia]
MKGSSQVLNSKHRASFDTKTWPLPMPTNSLAVTTHLIPMNRRHALVGLRNSTASPAHVHKEFVSNLPVDQNVEYPMEIIGLPRSLDASARSWEAARRNEGAKKT